MPGTARDSFDEQSAHIQNKIKNAFYSYGHTGNESPKTVREEEIVIEDKQ